MLKLLNDLLAQYDYLNALEAYNDGNGGTILKIPTMYSCWRQNTALGRIG
jgi:hypothetical protein